MRNIGYWLLLGLLVSSCATSKKLDAVQSKLDDCEKANTEASRDLSAAQIRISNLSSDSAAMQKRLDEIIADTVRQSKELHQTELQLSSLRSLYNQLNDQLGKNNLQGEKEIKALLSDLQKSQEKLQVREDALLKAENDLQSSAKALAEKEKKVEYLSKKLTEQDSLMRNLRQKVATALKGFVGNGLEVINKNGKVYVSMDEKLLFQSGSWNVDEKGVAALDNISKLLAENKDLQVVIEGHTDDLPYRGYGNVDDNWDLSTKRATSIVRILLKNEGVDPSRVTASGRAEFVPIDTSGTREARQRNRRTEIIISPNVDEIMKIVGGE
ncbi:MAG: OmpA family protein [Paludibacteraceae bacterium]|nr:OmpA family protein [Paludibacteraceae bacterium]